VGVLLVGIGTDFRSAFGVSRSDTSLPAHGLPVLRLPLLGDDASFTLLVLPRRPPRGPSLQADDCDENKAKGNDDDEDNVQAYPALGDGAPHQGRLGRCPPSARRARANSATDRAEVSSGTLTRKRSASRLTTTFGRSRASRL
jgi:hypothetical protein